MKKNSVIVAAHLLLFIFTFHLYANESDAQRSNRLSAANDALIAKHLSRATALYTNRIHKTEAVAASDELKIKAGKINKIMKKRGEEYSDSKPPQTLEEATTFLRRVSMACLPAKAFEHDGVFYFSGGTSATPITDFSSGFAIRKGESIIYTWSPSSETNDVDRKDDKKGHIGVRH